MKSFSNQYCARPGNLANAYDELGEYELKQAALERCLAILHEINGHSHPSVCIHLTNLGMTHNQLGICAFLEKLHPQRIADVLISSTGMKYGDEEEFKKAKDILERALKINNKIFGESHTETSHTLGKSIRLTRVE